MSEKNESSNNLAFEFRPIYEIPEPTPTKTAHPNNENWEAQTPTSTSDIEEGDALVNRDYTPTWTDDLVRLIGVTVNTIGNHVTISIKTSGTYDHWRYSLGGIESRVFGAEYVSFNLPDGHYNLKVWLSSAFDKVFPNTDILEEEFSIPGGEGKSEHIIHNCWDDRYLLIKHYREVDSYSYLEIEEGEYSGCYSFTAIKNKNLVNTENEIALDWSGITVKHSAEARSSLAACDCCYEQDCTEHIFIPEEKDLDLPPPPTFAPIATETNTPSPSVTFTFTPTELLSQEICNAELIIKDQKLGEGGWQDNTIQVKKEVEQNTSSLHVKGCPPGFKPEETFYVWLKRSDSCKEEWMNEGNPYEFELITEEICGCEPYLQTKENSLIKNKAPDLSGEDEIIKGLSLLPNGEPVYIVHMLISSSPDPSESGKQNINFYERYISKDLPEVFADIVTEGDTRNRERLGNLYLSPSDENQNYFGAKHVIEVGKTISSINRIYFSEDLPIK